MRTVILHLERLRRHYESSMRSHDEISLLDLSHSLRVWADLKSALPEMAPKFATTQSFKTAIPAKKVLKAARGSSYVFAYMPGGVVSFATDGKVAEAPPLDDKSDFLLGASCKVNFDGSLELKNYCFVGKALEEPLIKALSAEDMKRCNFAQWLGAEAVRLAYKGPDGTLQSVSVSREMIIRRVANTLDGSHPSAGASILDKDTVNSFDPAVHHLLQYKMGGLTLPYFILLKIAQDIVAIAPKLLGVEEAA